MPRINAGQDFGRLTPQAGGFADTPQVQPGRAMGELGQRMEAEGLQQERIQAAEVKQQEHEAKVARDAADRARASSVLSLTRDRVGDTLASIEQEVADGRLPKGEAIKAWRERTQELIQSSLGDAPEAHKALIQQDLQGLVTRFDSKVGDIVRRRDQQDTRADLTTTLESLQRQATTDYNGARMSALAALDQLGPASGMAPDQIAKAKQAWVEGAAYTRAYTALNLGKNDNRALASVEQAIQQNQDLDPQKRAQLLGQVETYRAANEARALRAAQHAEIVAARNEREAAKAWDVLSGWAMAGKTADPQAAAGLVAKLDPTRLAAYKAMAAEIPARTAAAMLPLQQQQSQLDALIARRTANGTSQELEKEIDRRQKVLDESRREYAADPLRAAASRGVIDQIAPLDMNSIEGLAGSLAGRVSQAQTVATRAGRPVSPLLPEEASRLSDFLAKMPVQQQARAIVQLSQALPSGMGTALAAQIDGKDKGLALALAAGASQTTAGRSTAEIILRGRQARLDGTSTKGEKQPDVKAAGWKAHAATELDGVFLNQQHATQVRDAAELIMHGIAAEQGGRLYREDMDRAVRLAAGSGEIVEHNGRRIPLPAGMSEREFSKRVDSVTPAEIEAQAPGGMVRAGGAVVPVAEFVKTLPGQQLAPARPGAFGVLVGGRPVVNTNGDPIVIKVR